MVPTFVSLSPFIWCCYCCGLYATSRCPGCHAFAITQSNITKVLCDAAAVEAACELRRNSQTFLLHSNSTWAGTWIWLSRKRAKKISFLHIAWFCPIALYSLCRLMALGHGGRGGTIPSCWGVFFARVKNKYQTSFLLGRAWTTDLRETFFLKWKIAQNQINCKTFFFFVRFEKVRSSMNKMFALFLQTSSNFVWRKFELVIEEVQRNSSNFGVAGVCITPNMKPLSFAT
jgi:hypothetical protein